jgi:demethylmenaquinone methyltransferase / 2-methoxy-6-polyprenyl-1,4-benzoquinol methylase
MFDDIVERYDLLNDLISFGLARSWRRAAARAVAVPAGGRVLDLGCGTGNLGALLPRNAMVVGVDLSYRMLVAARRQTGRHVVPVRASAFGLPFGDRTFDASVSGFLLRNLDDLPVAFGELARVLVPGSSVALLDITEPRSKALRQLFDLYFGAVPPALGALVGKRRAYGYLARSLAQLPAREEVCRMLEAAGFSKCRAKPLSGGVVTLWTATRRP